MTPIETFLKKNGPSRSSAVAKYLQKELGITSATARQRISRASPPVMKFFVFRLPKTEYFIYLKEHKESEIFWINFQKALRETNSVHGMAIDGMANRGNIVSESEFKVISGAPIALKNQPTSDQVARNLLKSKFISEFNKDGEKFYSLRTILRKNPNRNQNHKRMLQLTDMIILENLRDWAKKLGLASYNKIAIRGEKEMRPIGQFMWDLTGPSYLISMKSEVSKKNNIPNPGFLIADVFSQNIMNENDIKYFVRKVQSLCSSIKTIKIIPILVARGFEPSAMKFGKNTGVILATLENLFGKQAAEDIHELAKTLEEVATIAIENPSQIFTLIENLTNIEGAQRNIRGILFEVISLHLAKNRASSVEHSKNVTDPEQNKEAEIDVLRIIDKTHCVAIECKGKAPGGKVDDKVVKKWIDKIFIIKKYLSNQDQFKESKIDFEIWTTGSFTPNALSLLKREKEKRKKNQIDWKDGEDIFKLAKEQKETGIVKALNEQFRKHPLSQY